MPDLLTVLRDRGFLQQATAGLEARLAAGPITGYVGFDPTADSLHVGNLVPVMALAWLQRTGGTPIALVGGGTGMVGDPSGKRQERPVLPMEQIDANAAAIRAQLARFLAFEGSNAARMCNNADWLRTLGLMEFLRDVGKHFGVGAMLQKESIRSRVGSEDGISYTEFSYMLIQAYDFWHLFRAERLRAPDGRQRPVGEHHRGDRPDRQPRAEARPRAGHAADHDRFRHEIREKRGGQRLARSGEDEPVPVLSVLAQHGRS